MASEMARATATIPQLAVTAVLSRSADRADAFCKLHSLDAIGCSDIGDFFDQTDAVYIATPPGQHAALLDNAIDAGKPALCEKPLTGSPEETGRVLSKARAQGVLVMEAIWTLALPAYRALKTRTAHSRPGFLQFDFSYPLNASDKSHYLDPENGGVLLDRAVYGYAAAIHLLGDVVSQSVFVTRNADGLDTSAELRLEHEGHARSLITLAFDRVGPNLLHLSNEFGLLTLGPSSLAGETLVHRPYPKLAPSQDGPKRIGLKDRLKSMPALRRLKARVPTQPEFFGFGASSYAPILQEFQTTIAQGKIQSNIVPHDLSERVSRLTHEARSQ